MISKTLFLVIFLIVGSVATLISYNKAELQSTNNIGSKNENVTNNGKLNLSNKGLKKIPEYVFSETNIKELDVSNNVLEGSIQGEIRHLRELRVINASNNLMTGVPAEIGQLEKLEVLNLSNNKLTGLPNELGNLKNLKTLNLSGNQYSKQDLDYIRNKLPSSVNIITD